MGDAYVGAGQGYPCSQNLEPFRTSEITPPNPTPKTSVTIDFRMLGLKFILSLHHNRPGLCRVQMIMIFPRSLFCKRERILPAGRYRIAGIKSHAFFCRATFLDSRARIERMRGMHC